MKHFLAMLIPEQDSWVPGPGYIFWRGDASDWWAARELALQHLHSFGSDFQHITPEHPRILVSGSPREEPGSPRKKQQPKKKGRR